MQSIKFAVMGMVMAGIAAAVTIGPLSARPAEAQFNPIDFIGRITGGLGGGQTVRVVSDVSETSIINTLKTTLLEATTAIMSGNISSLNIKETVLDPIAWNLAKQLQQQMTGDLLKWLGGQQPGQGGQVPFVQDFGAHYESIMDQVYGDFINELSGANNSGLCSEEQRHQVQQAVISYYREQKQEMSGEIFSCSEGTASRQGTVLEQIFQDTVNCDGDAVCAGLKAQRILAERQASAIMNEKQALDYSRGMLPQRVCRTVSGASGSRQACEITNPLFLAADTISFQLGQVPSLQLLQMDEFNEIVSGFMTSLTNQALQGLGGVLGLSGNANFLNNVFGPSGNLSYVDALIQDDISQYQSGVSNNSPIKQSIAAEEKHLSLQTTVYNRVVSIENRNSSNRSAYGSCYDLSVPNHLAEAKNNASIGMNNASTSLAILRVLDSEYTNAPSATAKNAIMATYTGYKNQGVFREDHQNRDMEVSYVQYTFATMAEQFICEMSAKATSCGGQADSECRLSGGS